MGSFFVQKKGGGLWPCIDYQGLNQVFVKNLYVLSLGPAALEKLCQVIIFAKLDLSSAYKLNTVWYPMNTKECLLGYLRSLPLALPPRPTSLMWKPSSLCYRNSYRFTKSSSKRRSHQFLSWFTLSIRIFCGRGWHWCGSCTVLAQGKNGVKLWCRRTEAVGHQAGIRGMAALVGQSLFVIPSTSQWTS